VRRVESARAPNLALNTSTAMINLLIYKPYVLMAVVAVIAVNPFRFSSPCTFYGNASHRGVPSSSGFQPWPVTCGRRVGPHGIEFSGFRFVVQWPSNALN